MSASILSAISVRTLDGVGEKMAERLEKISIFTIQDLLLHLPHRYEDRTKIWPIASLKPGQHASIQVDILQNDITQGRRRMLTVNVRDSSGALTLRFFNFNAAMKNSLAQGKKIIAYGEIKRGKFGPEIIHPEYQLITENNPTQKNTAPSLTPVYPTTEGVKQLLLRQLTDQALQLLENTPIDELLPDGLYPDQLPLKSAIHLLHRPPPTVLMSAFEEGKHPAQRRLIIEELLAQHLSMLAARQTQRQDRAAALPLSSTLAPAFLASLPFTPTSAQTRVVKDIAQDMTQNAPMMRLVQGDVGSGKTLVAALAALQAIEQGKQVALMAPTELLAEQHAANFEQWLSPLGVQVGWLAGKLTEKTKKIQLHAIEIGETKMVVGTHALFQKQVVFHDLALVIIDEQHRFGVHQRLSLREKGKQAGYYPHQLIMTATPIPRTLAMTAYADLDTSIIDELPPGRTPITTVAVPDSRRIDVIERVHAACLDGRQAYWVCTLIDESEVLEAQAAADTADDLSRALPDLRIGLVHGRMKATEKQAVMQAFKNGELHLLVATTVIEVGVDVPNASLMIIENPERLGLAQLHQLRGRVGRGSVASHCLLLYKAPLSKTATKRLGVLRESCDGFVIAQQDLEIRGPGELLGTKQTGVVEFKIADLIRDQALIPDIQKMAHRLHQDYPDNAKQIIQRWLGHKDKYSRA